jgi:hypothetical protein
MNFSNFETIFGYTRTYSMLCRYVAVKKYESTSAFKRNRSANAVDSEDCGEDADFSWLMYAYIRQIANSAIGSLTCVLLAASVITPF